MITGAARWAGVARLVRDGARAVAPVLAAGLVLLASRAARADQVAVLRFAAGGGVTTAVQVDGARAATRDAVLQIKDTLPPPALASAAEVVVRDGAPDTTQEYRTAGRAAGSQWTVAGRVDAHGWTYRLELEVCQVETGRVESLAREIDARQPVPQIAEMLALLLRPAGVGDTVPPWEQAGSPAVPPAPAPPVPVATPVTVATPPPPAPEPPAPPIAYQAEHPLGAGLGIEVLGAFRRADNARGAAVSGGATLDVGYALAAIRGFELRAGIGAAAIGPQSLRLDVGARMVFPVGAHVFAGPELMVGGFVPLGGDRDVRLWFKGAIPIVVPVSDRVQIEAYPQIAYAAGGTASLGLVGGGARAVLRF